MANPTGIMVNFPTGGTYFIASDTVYKKSHASRAHYKTCKTGVLLSEQETELC
jgi:hypothetical protein